MKNQNVVQISESTVSNIVERVLNESSDGLDFDFGEDKLTITANASAIEDIQDMVDSNSISYAEYEIFGDYSGIHANGGTILRGDQFGQMTEAIFVFWNNEVYSDFKYYQIRSFITDLIEDGVAYLDRVREFSSDDAAQILDDYYDGK